MRKNSEYFKVLILRTIGNFLLFSSIFMIIKTFYQPIREEFRFFIDRITEKKYTISDVNNYQNINQQSPNINKITIVDLFKKNQTKTLIPEDPYFSIIIPKIGANAKIIPNVNAGEKQEYLDSLQQGVAHTLGTSFPGEKGHIFLFAHSTDYFWNIGNYNAVFYLLYKLEKNDNITIVYQGKRYLYKVIGSQIVNPSQVEYVSRKSNKEFLTLQTCWPPGTTLKRLLVYAIRASE